MNIIFNDSHNNIGGIEVMFIEMAKYLSEKNSVYFIVDQNNIYEEFLSNYQNIFFIRKELKGNIEFLSSKKITREKEDILSQLNLKDKYIVISPYYHKLQYAMAIFKGNENFKHINLWSHPENWAKNSTLLQSKYFTKKRVENPKFYYQKDLINALSERNAHFYSARSVVVFNNWFYSLSLDPPIIDTLPIQSTEESPKIYEPNRSFDTIKVLWCGRFAKFKNESIIEISKVLNSLAIKFPEIKIEYGIIGFGRERDEQYVKRNIKEDNIKVRYLGKISPDKLPKIFKEYDIGIGMGLTVKKMAQVGLPAIVIDSVEKEVNHKKNCNWLFDTSEGDAGDGYYFKIANEVIENRQELSIILEKLFEEPYLLKKYSKKCLAFVEKYYSFEKQVQAIIDTGQNSTFISDTYPIFRRNFVSRTAYNIYKRLKLLNA